MLTNSMRLQFIPYEIFEPDQQHNILHFDQKTKLGPKSSRSLMTSGLNCNPDLHPKCLLPQALLGSQTTLSYFLWGRFHLYPASKGRWFHQTKLTCRQYDMKVQKNTGCLISKRPKCVWESRESLWWCWWQRLLQAIEIWLNHSPTRLTFSNCFTSQLIQTISSKYKQA